MKKLSKLSIIGYGAGDAANNLAFTTATMFLLVYYTDVAGISAAAAGTLLLAVRVFDAFADVLAGRDLQATFTAITLAFVVIGAALYFFTVLTTKERVHRAVPNVTLKQSMDTLKSNKPLLMLCLSSFLFLSGYLALTSVQLYYLRDVLGRLDLYPVLSITQLVLTFVLAAIMPRLVRTVGKKRVYLVASLISATGGAIVFFTPASQVWIGFSGLLISLGGVLAVSIVVWALEADTVEYGEWKTGVRTEGITYALFSFTRKTGQAVGGALAAYALALGGYKSGAAQTAEAVQGIQVSAGAIPAVLTILAVLVMSKYTLTDAMHATILTEIQGRRLLSENAGEKAGETSGVGATSRVGTISEADADGAAAAAYADPAPLAPRS